MNVNFREKFSGIGLVYYIFCVKIYREFQRNINKSKLESFERDEMLGVPSSFNWEIIDSRQNVNQSFGTRTTFIQMKESYV